MGTKLRPFMAFLLSFCLILSSSVYIDGYMYGNTSSAYGKRADGGRVRLLNDRTADLTGCAAVCARDLAVPGGLTGRGQTVGLADSGLDKGSLLDMHPDLVSVPGEIPKVISLRSWAGRSLPDDPIGHGTHMAATIAGTGKASNGQYKGVAPNASLYFQALLDPQGKLQVPQDIVGMFAAAYRAGVRVHVNGWGTEGNTYGGTARQIDGFVRAYPDFLPVFGAGNSGPGRGTLTGEANSKNVLVVGALQTPRPSFGPDAADAEKPASFSSRGPAADGRIKPDLMVPASAVISACSRLTESNFAPDTDYTRMGGTSMAAAIAGGAIALLREYLEKEGTAQPSAALVKALLINGSRLRYENVTRLGFGTLDLAQTILMLKEGLARFEDDRQGLANGQERQWQIWVHETELPLVVTLAWTDVPGTGKGNTLVNDLDLIVETPDGKIYTGNHFLGLNEPDTCNNVEQVRIEEPIAGEYKVRVRVSSVQAGALIEGRLCQDYAIVFGQQLARDVVTGCDNTGVKLAERKVVPASGLQPVVVVNGMKVPFSPERVLVGSDVYLGVEKIYIFGRTYQAAGVQVLSVPQGKQVMEINPQVRAGGYFVDTRAAYENDRMCTLNGEPAAVSDLPAGVELWASINPATQKVWQIKASLRKEEGVIQALNCQAGTVKLWGKDVVYRVGDRALVTFVDECIDAGLDDRPYGTTQASDLRGLLPGMPVTLYQSCATGDIMYIKVQRQVAQGRLAAVDAVSGRLVLETGKEYSCFSGISIARDGEPCELKALKPGDYAKLVLVPKSSRVLALEGYSRVIYGQVVFFGERQKKLYITGQDNIIRELSVDEKTQIFRWGLPVDPAAVQPGNWVRAVADKAGQTLLRLDLAETAEEIVGLFDGYREAPVRTLSVEGREYLVGDSTLVTKGGYWIDPQDIVPGDEVRLAALSLAGSEQKLAVLVAGEVNPGAKKPFLAATVKELNGVLVIDGQTSGYVVYLYREDGSRTRIKLDQSGRFSCLAPARPGEKEVEILALDKSGGLASLAVKIEPFVTSRGEARSFADIRSSREGQTISKLAAAGVTAGYPDGTYRPDKAVTRLEFLLMLVRAGGGQAGFGQYREFRDLGEVPVWAKKDLAEAIRRGLVAGYPDGTLRPNQPVTRAEMAAVLVRAFGAGPAKKPPYSDLRRTPQWARWAVVQAWSRGWLDGLQVLSRQRFGPYRRVTRTEAALCLARALGYVP